MEGNGPGAHLVTVYLPKAAAIRAQGKTKKYTSKHTSGDKPTEVSEGIEEASEPERVRSCREVNFLPRLNSIDLDLLKLKLHREAHVGGEG